MMQKYLLGRMLVRGVLLAWPALATAAGGRGATRTITARYFVVISGLRVLVARAAHSSGQAQAPAPVDFARRVAARRQVRQGLAAQGGGGVTVAPAVQATGEPEAVIRGALNRLHLEGRCDDLAVDEETGDLAYHLSLSPPQEAP